MGIAVSPQIIRVSRFFIEKPRKDVINGMGQRRFWEDLSHIQSR